MRRLKFGIRTLLSFTTLLACILIYGQERARYFREHVFVQVLDRSTGLPLNPVRYRFSIITEKTGAKPAWTPWQLHHESNPLVLACPSHCIFMVQTQGKSQHDGNDAEQNNPESPEGSEIETALIAPDSPHEFSIRVDVFHRVQGKVIDSQTGNPIEGAEIRTPNMGKNRNLEGEERLLKRATTNKDGVFQLQSIDPAPIVLVCHPDYEYGVDHAQPNTPMEFRLAEGSKVVGMVVNSSDQKPLRNAIVSVEYPQSKLNESELVPTPERHKAATWLKWIGPRRSVRTDHLGQFQLTIEQSFSEACLNFHKSGWHEMNALTSSVTPSTTELVPNYFSAAGHVVDEQGSPISAFTVVYEHVTAADRMLHSESVVHENGYFEICSNYPPTRFWILADGFSLKEISTDEYLTEYNRLNEARVFYQTISHSKHAQFKIELPTTMLSRGYTVDGVMNMSPAHTQPATVELLDQRREPERENAQEVFVASQQSLEGLRMQNAMQQKLLHRMCTVSDDGRFQFDHMADGKYLMQSTYNGQIFDKQMIEVAGSDINIHGLQAPAFGSGQGTILEIKSPDVSNNGLLDTPDRLISETNFKPFRLYDLVRNGQRTTTRTNHFGRFSAEHLLTGTYKINTSPGNAYLQQTLCPVFSIEIQPGKISAYPVPLTRLCDLEIVFPVRELKLRREQNAKLLSLEQSPLATVWIESLENRSRDGNALWRCFVPKGISEGSYELEMDLVGGSKQIDIDFTHSQISPIIPLFVREFFVPELEVTQSNCNFMVSRGGKHLQQSVLHKGRVVGLTHDLGNFDVDLYDAQLGWAHIPAVSFAPERIDFTNLEWRPGCSVTVHGCRTEWRAMYPDLNVLLKHRTSGLKITPWRTAFKSENLPPGTWDLTVTGTDINKGRMVIHKETFEAVENGSIEIHLP